MRLDILGKRIIWLLNASVVLLVIVGVMFCLSLVLDQTSDDAGAAAVRGLMYAAISLLGVDILVLLGCMATAIVGLIERGSCTDATESKSSSDSLKGGPQDGSQSSARE